MAKIVPLNKPAQSAAQTREILKKAGVDITLPAILGDRAYYQRTMGDPNSNDRGIYDDAIFLVSPSVHAAFNSNVDPSVYRTGIATLIPGLWKYKIGIHGLSKPKPKQYLALVQAAKVTVRRDKEGLDTGYFGINIHRGGYGTTSSLGCQTIYPTQWDAFFAMVQSEMKRYSVKTIPYLLLA